MKVAIERFKQYVATYPTDGFTLDQSDETFIKDMLYGIGVTIDGEGYMFADGFRAFIIEVRNICESPQFQAAEPPAPHCASEPSSHDARKV